MTVIDMDHDRWQQLSFSAECARAGFRAGVLTENIFREQMRSLGYSGTRLDAEVDAIRNPGEKW